MNAPNFPPTREDWVRAEAALEKLRAETDERHNQMFALGYTMASGIGSQLADLGAAFIPSSEVPQRTFHVWRVDQPSDTAKIFTEIAEVNTYLEHVTTFPGYYLQLQRNPRLVIDTDRDRTVITDKLSGESFSVRTTDVDNATQLCVHAESTPTIGDWTQA
jgi:hypothetical protein